MNKISQKQINDPAKDHAKEVLKDLIDSAAEMLTSLQEIASIANSRGPDVLKLRMISNEAETIIAKVSGSKSLWKGDDHG